MRGQGFEPPERESFPISTLDEEPPGITRDRKELEAEWLDVPFLVVDTGGWMPGGDSLDVKVSRQVEAAVKEADVVLFVIDASVSLTDDDQQIANWVRRSPSRGNISYDRSISSLIPSRSLR